MAIRAGWGHHAWILDSLRRRLVMRQLVCTWSTLDFLTFELILVSIVSLWLHLIALEPLVNQNTAHIHTKAIWWHPRRHHPSHLLLLLHIQRLNTYQILHILPSSILELPFDLLHWCHRLLLSLLHLELHIVEHSVEIDWVELHWHFDSRILLEMHQWLLALLRVHHSSGTFDPLAFFHCDFFTIEDHELDESLNDDHSVIRLACDWVMNQ